MAHGFSFRENLGSLLVELTIGITGCSSMTEDQNKVDMHKLKQL